MALWRVLDQNEFYRPGRRREVTKGLGFDAVTRRVTATPGSRPKKRKGKLYWRARALEFPALRAGNSVGSKRRFVSANNRGAPEMGTPLLLAERVGFEPTWACAQTDFESAPL